MLRNGNFSMTDPITEKRVAHTIGQFGAGNTPDYVIFDKQNAGNCSRCFPGGFPAAP